jgi:hypothetical protein
MVPDDVDNSKNMGDETRKYVQKNGWPIKPFTIIDRNETDLAVTGSWL